MSSLARIHSEMFAPLIYCVIDRALLQATRQTSSIRYFSSSTP